MPAPSTSHDDRRATAADSGASTGGNAAGEGRATAREIAPTAEEKLWRMRAIACELSLAGLDTHIHEAFSSIDVTATCRTGGRRETEAIVDDDGYAELRFWTDPQATPAEVSVLITQALAAAAAAPHDSP